MISECIKEPCNNFYVTPDEDTIDRSVETLGPES